MIKPQSLPDWVVAYNLRTWENSGWRVAERSLIDLPALPVCTTGCQNEFPDEITTHFPENLAFAIIRAIVPAFEAYALALQHISDRHGNLLDRSRRLLYPHADVMLLLPRPGDQGEPEVALLSDLLKESQRLGQVFEDRARASGRYSWLTR
jgi:hypothetical protein